VYLASGDLWLGVPATALAVAYLGGVTWIMWRSARSGRGRLPGGRQAVQLYESGLVVTERGETAAYHWDDLASVTVGGVQKASHRPTRWRFTIGTSGGEVIELGDDLPDVRELGEKVVAEVTARVVPQALARIRAGETVRVGPFAAGPDGVEKDGERVPWPALGEVGIGNGVVYVRTHDGLRAMAAVAGGTPNAVAFVELCRQIRALRSGEDPVPRRRR
jgi:hypothetical protein